MRNKTICLWLIVMLLLLGSLLGVYSGETVHAASARQVTAVPPNNDLPTETPAPTFTSTFTETFTPTWTYSVTDTPTTTAAWTSTSTPTDTSTPTHTFTATYTQVTTLTSAPAHLVISEFRSRGPNGNGDEFVELYNPTGDAVNIGGWSIRRSAGCGAATYSLVSIASNTTLQAGQHFLAVSSTSTVTGADQPTFLAALADDGGLALVDLAGQVVDQAGMCINTQYREGANLAPLSGTANQSYERKPGGDTACYDTDNNASDFALISSSNPQNKASPVVMCAGVVAFTPTYTLTSTSTSMLTSTPTPTQTRTPTRTPTHTPARFPTAFPGLVVINEFLPRPHTDWNEDGTVNVGDEYIELLNIGATTVNIKNWKLDNGGKGYYTLPDRDLLPRQIVVFFHSESGISLRDGGGTVRLLKPDGYIADFDNYPKVKATDQIWCRLPDGTGGWAFACQPGPGRPNIPFDSATPTPGSGPGMGEETDCSLIDTAPQSVVLAECVGFGSGIWNAGRENQLWLHDRWKWSVFVE